MNLIQQKYIIKDKKVFYYSIDFNCGNSVTSWLAVGGEKKKPFKMKGLSFRMLLSELRYFRE
ncbi:hypothetical protein D0C36_19755 [Mucilaginibacter conchicola]|uniref:Uncharacterized protein n=1 Tax=Mucilaginibacter conchicola TaxID=2303333 RepID=A0A372NRG1_9SPHI|nr:hypothetical protein D0C36_19755 [Mucilaginibacter conchicola]